MEYDALAIEKSHSRIFGLRTHALLEIVIFFLVMFLINMFTGSPRFVETEPHPYWIIVLLLSMQYGSNEGILAVLVSSVALLLFNLPQQEVGQDLYAWLYEVAYRPILWLVAAVLLGLLRDRHMRERDTLREALVDTRERERTFADSYEKLRTRKEQLELNIAGRVRTETGALRAAKAIEKLDPESVIDGVATMVEAALGAEKFSLYLLTGDKLTRHLTQGWSEQDEMSLQQDFKSQDAIYQAVIARKETLCIVNESQQSLLHHQGILAGPLLDTQTGNVLGMLKIEAIPFLEFNLETVESFKALCEWIALALVNARYYQLAMDESVVNPEHNLMTRSFFNRYRDYITALARRMKFNVFMLDVTVTNYQSLDADTQVKVARLLSETVDKTLRNVDFAFDHQEVRGNYAIVLPATNEAGAKVVRDKIEKELLRMVAGQARGVNFSFSLTALHEV